MQAREQKGELAFFRLPFSSICHNLYEDAADSLGDRTGEKLGRFYSWLLGASKLVVATKYYFTFRFSLAVVTYKARDSSSPLHV